jgi:hypothetical protein
LAKFWKRHEELDLEGELRAARPEPRPEFLQMLSERVGERRRSYRGVRMALAASVAAMLLVAVAAVGGIGYAASAGHQIVKVASSVANVHGPTVVKKSAAADQYKRIKVCRNGRVVLISQNNVRSSDKKVSQSAKVGAKCGARPRHRRRGAPAFTG